jgi:hypothetical protein
MACQVRRCETRHFMINLTHVYEFCQDELDAQQPHQVMITNVLYFLLFE